MKKRISLIVAVVVILIAIFLIFKINKGNIASGVSKEDKVSISSLLSLAKDMQARNNMLQERDVYQKLVNEFPSSSEVMYWQKKIEDLNIKIIFSSSITPKSRLYEIKPGDTLTKIAKESKTTTDLIMKSNNLASSNIIPGRKIKVWTAPFTIFVDKSQNILLLKSDDEIIKTYIVSTGKNNCTPVGTFKITNKLPNPTWFKAGAVVPAGSPENILGSRWMGFDLAGYGIHGTTEPQSLGRQVTQGCVRMNNSEVEELYTIVPAGTEVTIVD